MKMVIPLDLEDIETAIKTRILTKMGPDILRILGDTPISFMQDTTTGRLDGCKIILAIE